MSRPRRDHDAGPATERVTIRLTKRERQGLERLAAHMRPASVGASEILVMLLGDELVAFDAGHGATRAWQSAAERLADEVCSRARPAAAGVEPPPPLAGPVLSSDERAAFPSALLRLDLSWPCSLGEVRRAQRRRAGRDHADAGGTDAEMCRTNDAAALVARVIARSPRT